jgi:lipopolysaccharide transport system ATP-binding protein
MSSNDIAIKVENISKIYRIGMKKEMQENFAGAIFNFIKSPWKNYRKYRSLYKFEDINLDHSQNPKDTPSDIIFAVNDVSFEMKKGEVLGLIGGNGAGKSTLLKILAKITDPTSGQAEIKGRISSLLEVGTGFHKELTGRENIYLNGTILGMKKREVDRKFDEIVEFSGVEKFIDTPVKRYSSGMKVRLAFAVAAFMEPEILLVDEVLAVGDAAFQRKCLGKMSEVSKQGRTIIFVSHNMPAIANLCDRAILLESGTVKLDTDPNSAITGYLESISNFSKTADFSKIPRLRGHSPIIQKIKLFDKKENSISSVQMGDSLTVHIYYTHSDKLKNPHFGLIFETLMGVKVFWLNSRIQRGTLPDLASSGIIECHIPRLPLVPGTYFISAGCGVLRNQLDFIERAYQIQVTAADVFGTGKSPDPKVSLVFVDAEWEPIEGVDDYPDVAKAGVLQGQDAHRNL